MIPVTRIRYPIECRNPSPLPPRIKVLYPRLMTIGIGVLCCSKDDLRTGERPDTIVMMADTMGSTAEDSTDEL